MEALRSMQSSQTLPRESDLVLGLFRRGSIRQRFVDSEPVFLILMYNIWPVLTKRFFSFIFCKPYPTRGDPMLSRKHHGA